jgi:hypothetical protein
MKLNMKSFQFFSRHKYKILFPRTVGVFILWGSVLCCILKQNGVCYYITFRLHVFIYVV